MKISKELISSSYNFACRTKNVWFRKGWGLYYASMDLREIAIEVYSFMKQLKSQEINNKSGKEVIWNVKRIDMLHQATMLMGFAIENFLKGIIIEVERIKLDDEIKKLPDFIKSHDLKTLGEKAEISFNKKDEIILLRFTESIEFSGRYPIPVRVEEYHKHFNKNAEPAFLINNNNKDELPEQVLYVFDKILKKMKEIEN
jgi:hypothetical protein